VPCRERTSKAIKYGTRSQGISQFYLHTPRTSANGMNHTCKKSNNMRLINIAYKLSTKLLHRVINVKIHNLHRWSIIHLCLQETKLIMAEVCP